MVCVCDIIFLISFLCVIFALIYVTQSLWEKKVSHWPHTTKHTRDVITGRASKPKKTKRRGASLWAGLMLHMFTWFCFSRLWGIVTFFFWQIRKHTVCAHSAVLKQAKEQAAYVEDEREGKVRHDLELSWTNTAFLKGRLWLRSSTLKPSQNKEPHIVECFQPTCWGGPSSV